MCTKLSRPLIVKCTQSSIAPVLGNYYPVYFLSHIEYTDKGALRMTTTLVANMAIPSGSLKALVMINDKTETVKMFFIWLQL